VLTNVLLVLVILLVVWNGVLTFFLFSTVTHYRKLIKSGKEADLKKILEKVLDSEVQNKKDIKTAFEKLAILEQDGLTHIQKLGLVKYNPFNDTGGDHSFSLAVLDKNRNGFVLTGLHTRDKTRFYVKSIKSGISTKELSDEEARAIEIAVKS
jgi:hypothetical protein